MRLSSLRHAAAVGLIAVVAMAAPVAAIHNRTVDGDRVWLTVGVWGGWANFGAMYNITYYRSEGTSEWLFKGFGMDGVVERGKECPSFQCEAWASGMTATFLDSSGGQVAKVGVLPGYCHDYAITNIAKLFAHCKPGPFTVKISATKIKFRWTISVRRSDGLWLSWIDEKTVPIS